MEVKDDLIDRQAAIDALWKALYDYEDKSEKQFQELDELDVGDWIRHRIFVQNMSDIDRKVIQDLPSTEPKTGRWIEYPECLRFIGAYSEDHIVCDYCGAVFSVIDNCTEEFKFCPCCGARMVDYE